MINIFVQAIKKLFTKLGATSDITFLYDCMRLHPIMFLNEYKELMQQELIKRNICPECRSDLLDKVCPKCKILYEV